MKFDVVIIGGGLSGLTAGVALLQEGFKVAAVADGLSLHETPRDEFRRLGGVLFPGDRAIDGEMAGCRISRIRTRNFGDLPLEADAFVLATGKFFSRGLVSTRETIFEPVFGLDVNFIPERAKWCDMDFAAPQNFEKFGVKVDGNFNPSVGGLTLENLFATGEIVEGCSSVGSGAVSAIKGNALCVASKVKEWLNENR